MKNIPRILALGLIAGVSAFAATYNAYNEFGGTNPTGVWSYGTANPANPGVFTPFSPGSFNGSCASGLACWIGSNSVSLSKPNSTFAIGTVLFQLNFLTLHPGSDGTVAVLRFTAPTADAYTFNASFIDQDISGGNGVSLLFGFETTPAPTVGSEVVGANFLATPLLRRKQRRV